MKQIGICFFATMFLVLILPGCISLIFGTEANYSLTDPINAGAAAAFSEMAEDRIESMPEVQNPGLEVEGEIGLEDYLVGVLAAEMSPEYEMEALKAQAVAARTYACRHLDILPSGTVFLTTEDIETVHQAYFSPSQQKQRWGEKYEDYEAKLAQAVKATEGEILVYEEMPIEAVFHSTSAGMTEDAEKVWNQEYPYLKSVVSKEDTVSSEFMSEATFTNKEVLQLLKARFSGLNLSDAPFIEQFHIIRRSDAGYVETAQAGSGILTGRQLREVLGLKSAAFDIIQQGDTVIFTTKGYGHGVGMSQNGANQMAKDGKSYVEILQHYYTEAELG